MRLIPNSGSSGNLHNYFTMQEFTQQTNQAPVVIPSTQANEQPVLRQSASRVTAFSSQYGGEESAFAYTAQNLAGETRIYPRYGDCSHAAVFRTFDRWWHDRSLLWFDDEFDSTMDPDLLTEDFIQLSYTTPVYLKAVEIYETFNVGHIVRVYAGYSATPDDPVLNWTLLYSGKPDLSLGKAARVFVPPLQLEKVQNQPINAIRLELCSHGAEYYPEIDAVYVHGYAIPNSVGKEQLYEPPEMDVIHSHSAEKTPKASPLIVAQLVDDLDDSPTSSSKAGTVTRNLWSLWSVQQALQDIQRLSTRIIPTPATSQPNLDSLPHELIHTIVSFLPRHDRTRTLARLQQVNKRFYAALRDPSMHLVVDLKPCWNTSSTTCLDAVLGRSRDTQRIRFSWLPASTSLTSFFTTFNSTRLQTLLLSGCQQIDDNCIGLICRNVGANLKTLDLSGCRSVTPTGFACLESLQQIRRLNLYRTLIAEPVLVAVLQELRQLEALDIGSLSKVNNMDAVLKCLSLSCPNLRALDCWRGKSVTHFGLRDLANGCPLLEQIDLGWCGDVRSSTSIFRHLAKSLPKLRRLLLTANRTICDADLDCFATYLFNSLEHLDILGCRDITAAGVLALLDRCPKLQFLDVSFCASLDFEEVTQLRKTFPRCAIKKSYQP